MTDATLQDREALLAREAALRERGGSLRMRDAAAALGVPEAALVEARRLGGAAVRLARPEAPEGFGHVLARLPEAGEVMALTRNETAVHEKVGRFAQPDIGGTLGQVVGDIDLRLFLQHWRFGYALTEAAQRSLQFFDATGTAIHKVYRRPETDDAAFERIVADFADPDAAPAPFEPAAPPTPERPDAEVDVDGLRAAWRGLRQTNMFFALMRQFGVTRVQAMRLAGPDLARPVPASTARAVLEGAAATGLPIMVFVGNRGCLQIHSGPVRRVEAVGPWLNVLDAAFNLHLREDRVTAAYVVRKPSAHGDIHALELYDAGGELAAQVFGHRPPQGEERGDWRALVTGLPGR
jgi:putative hemin transport protein